MLTADLCFSRCFDTPCFGDRKGDLPGETHVAYPQTFSCKTSGGRRTTPHFGVSVSLPVDGSGLPSNLK